MQQDLEQATKGLRVEEGRPRLIAVHGGKDIIFLHPYHGPDNYANVKVQIEQDNLATPTMAETASLVDAAFNSENRYSKGIKDVMRNRWLWAFTGTLYTPRDGLSYENGAIIENNPAIRNGMPYMDRDDLVKRLEANDSSVRFVPFGYKVGEMSSVQLAQNAYVIGIAGEEGAEKLAKVADKYRHNPYLFSFESIDKPLTRVSAVDSDGLDRRLVVDGLDRGDDRGGCAFGVLGRAGVASRAGK